MDMSRSMPNLAFSADPAGSTNAFDKKPFMYRGKVFDTTNVLDKSILKSRDLSKKMAPLPPLPCSASYTNLSTWNVDNSAIPEVQDAYITVVKHVMLREVALHGVSSLLRRCDETYWKYANLKVDAIEKNKSGAGESFNVILRTLSRLQDELAVALAHLRSLSISVVEEVLEWRLANRKNKMTKENISLYWKKENYLLKMKTDVTELLDVPIMWMWSGCEVNPFLIPPKGHNPADVWRRREEMYQTWLKKHKEHVQRALDKMKELTRAAMGRPTFQQRPLTPPPPLQQRSKSFLAAAESMHTLSEADEEHEEDSDSVHSKEDPSVGITSEAGSSHIDTCDTFESKGDDKPVVGSSLVIMNNRSSRLLGGPGSRSAEAGSCEADPPPEPRKSAMLLSTRRASGGRHGSSGTLLAPKSASVSNMDMLEEERDAHMDEDQEEEEEEESEQESAESEASSEESEVWKSLRKTCLESWLCMKGSKFAENGDPFWDNMDHSAVVIQAAVGFTETLPKKILLPQLHQGIVMLAQHLEGELHRETRVMARLEEHRAERTELKKTVLSAVEAQGIEWALQHSKSWHAFEAQNLLRFRQQYCPPMASSQSGPSLPAAHPLNDTRELPRGFSRGDGGERPRSAEDCLPSFSKFHDSTFDIFLTAEKDHEEDNLNYTRTFTPSAITIDKEKTMSRAINKIEDDRLLTARVRESVVVVKSRKSKRAMVERMRVTPAAILIQAVVRGMLTRRMLARSKASMRMFYSALLIQRGVRRIIARHRAQRLKLFLRRDGFIARREVLKKNKCAFVLTKFMRWAAFIVRKTKSVLQVSSISKELVKQQLQHYGRGSLKVQSMFRGHMARKRKRLASVVLDSLGPSDDGSIHSFSSAGSVSSARSDTYGTRKGNIRTQGMPSRPGLLKHASSSNMLGPKQSPSLKMKKMLSRTESPNSFNQGRNVSNATKTPATDSPDYPYEEKMLLDTVVEDRSISTDAHSPNRTALVSTAAAPALDPTAVVRSSLRMRAIRPPLGTDVLRKDSLFTVPTPGGAQTSTPNREAFSPTRTAEVDGKNATTQRFSKPAPGTAGKAGHGKQSGRRAAEVETSKPVDDTMKTALRELLLY